MPSPPHSRRPARKKTHRARIHVESLETRQLLSTVDSLLGASATRSSYQVNGSGLTAAVIDTGIDSQDVALGGGVGSGFKVKTSQSFISNATGTSVSTAHATAVAGLIASSDPNAPGIAPGAGLIDLKVFDNTGQGSFDAVANALQWVVDNHSQYHIGVVNLSLSDGNNYQHDWFSQDGAIGQKIDGLVKQLDALNIPVVAAAGNSFNGQAGMGFTAILPQTISVSSTGVNGQHLASDAQRLNPALDPISATKLVAPGVGLTAPAPGNQLATVDGTSFSAALVSGSVLLLEQIYENRFGGQTPIVAQVQGWLQGGSDPVFDPLTNATYDRLDIAKAAALIPQPSSQGISANPSPSSIVSTPVSADPQTSTILPIVVVAPPVQTQSSPTPPVAQTSPANTSKPVTGPIAQVIATPQSSPPTSTWTAWPSVYLNDPSIGVAPINQGHPAGSVRLLEIARLGLERIMRHQKLPVPHFPHHNVHVNQRRPR